jgi:hypothetical protein
VVFRLSPCYSLVASSLNCPTLLSQLLAGEAFGRDMVRWMRELGVEQGIPFAHTPLSVSL